MRGARAASAGGFAIDLGGTDVAIVFREIERKYDAAGAPAALDAVKSMTGAAGIAAVSQHDEETLDAVYYDTEDLRLIRAGVTLRRRTGGEDAGWHLKLPAGADTRDEIRLPLAAAGPAVEPTAGMAGRGRKHRTRRCRQDGRQARGKAPRKAAGAVPDELASLGPGPYPRRGPRARRAHADQPRRAPAARRRRPDARRDRHRPCVGRADG